MIYSHRADYDLAMVGDPFSKQDNAPGRVLVSICSVELSASLEQDQEVEIALSSIEVAPRGGAE